MPKGIVPQFSPNGSHRTTDRLRDDDRDAALYEVASAAVENLKTSEQQRPTIRVNVPPMTEPDGRTEAANALRLVERYGTSLRYAVEWGEWLVWRDGRWMRDTGSVVTQDMAIKVMRDLWARVADADNDHDRKLMVAFATASNRSNSIDNMIKLARSEAPLPVSASQLDTNPWLLKVANGTLDLKTGKLRADWQTDFITKLCPTAYKPGAACPTWERFLGEIFAGDAELIGYVQRLLGYCLTGDVREQILPILWGKGSNGKSTLVNAIAHVVGTDYGGVPPRQLFLASKFDRHPAELMMLQGKRLMMAQETESGAQLNEALIKNLTGGDKITARGMYQNFTTFQPTHKLLLSTNYKPQVRGSDYAMWRRLKLIPFAVTFEGKQLDKEMPNKLKDEAEGVLVWLVRGCLDWQRDGLREPESVAVATRAYADDQDEVGQFIAKCCERGEAYTTGATELYKAFKEATPESEMTQTAFGRELAAQGFEKGRTTKGEHKNRAVWKGLKLAGAVEGQKVVDALKRKRDG